MCGLVGIAGDTSGWWKDVFTDLLVIDSLRGAHSTGAAAIRRFEKDVNAVGLIKQVGGPHNLITTSEYKSALGPSSKALIGHNRYATVGEHTIANAHPFAFPSVVGAHNGTLDKCTIKLLHEYEKYGTDSEAIYANINEFGIQDTINKIQGAWALTWVDLEQNTINLLRNDKRPLYYMYSKDRCSVIWASEPDMIEFVVDRYASAEVENQYYVVEADQHYSWEIPPENNKKFAAPTRVKMAAPPPSAKFNWGPYYSEFGQYMEGGRKNVVPFKGKHQTGGTKNMETMLGRTELTRKFRPPYKLPGGKVLNKKQFEALTLDGCAFCQINSVPWGDFIYPIPTLDGHTTFICEECFIDDALFELVQNIA